MEDMRFEQAPRRAAVFIPLGTAIVRTSSGRMVDLAAPKPEDIVMDDVAHSLAGIARFNGYTQPDYYTVAEHSVIGSYQIEPEYALEFLLHDGPEAYLGDVIGPLKAIIGPVYGELERRWEDAFAARYYLRTHGPAREAVKRIDARMLRCEMVALTGRKPSEVGVRGDDDTSLVTALRMRRPENQVDPKTAFLLRFAELMDQRILGA